jgi:DNA transformation protein
MATQQSTMDYLLDQLREAGPVRCRKMFGEYCLYYDGSPVGLVCDNQLYLKPTDAGRALLTDIREGAPFPGARPHLLIDADSWDDARALSLLVRATALALPIRAPRPLKSDKPEAAKSRKTTKASERLLIADLPNLGPKSTAMLKLAGISNVQRLRSLGSVAAYVAVKRKSPAASLNLLWALEGALSDTPWQVVAREHRTSLLLALDQCEKDAAPTHPGGHASHTKARPLP